jgi:hypothetical protein
MLNNKWFAMLSQIGTRLISNDILKIETLTTTKDVPICQIISWILSEFIGCNKRDIVKM